MSSGDPNSATQSCAAPVAVQTTLLEDLTQPFQVPPWHGCQPFTISDVRAAIGRGDWHTNRLDAHTTYPMTVHIARIAYLVSTWVNNGVDAPELDVLSNGAVIVEDGYHRLCAAIVRGDPQTWVSLSGFLDAAEDALAVTIP